MRIQRPYNYAKNEDRPTVIQKQKAVSEKSKLNLNISISKPKEKWEIILSIDTNADTALLKVNGREEGGTSDGKYAIKRFGKSRWHY